MTACKSILLWSVVVLAATIANSQRPEGSMDTSLNVEQKWIALERRVKKFTDGMMKFLLPEVSAVVKRANVSSECVEDLYTVIDGLRNIKPWATRFVDSSAKVIDGILTGSLSSYGNYEECLDTVVPAKLKEGLFRGQYCLVEVKPPLPKKKRYPLKHPLEELKNISQRDTIIGELSKVAHHYVNLPIELGICVPSGCSKRDVNELATQLGNELYLTTRVIKCDTRGPKKFNGFVIFSLSLYSVFTLVAIIGTSLDLYISNRGTKRTNKMIDALLAFSITFNLKKLFSETKAKNISCLSGIKALTMIWIMMCHGVENIPLEIMRDAFSFKNGNPSPFIEIFYNGSLSVDTFFFVTGFLVGYIILDVDKHRNYKFNFQSHLSHRLFRLWPPAVFVVTFSFLFDVMGSGPNWNSHKNDFFEPCPRNWWINLLFIQNIYKRNETCNPTTWYLAVDIQLYLFAYLVLLIYAKSIKLGTIASTFIILTSMVFKGTITQLKGSAPDMLYTLMNPEEWDFFASEIYKMPLTHAAPFFIGLIVGSILITKPKIKLPWRFVLMGHCLATILNLTVLMGPWKWSMEEKPKFWESLLYAMFNRAAWSLGIAWVVICCVSGNGGIINDILSWRIWAPLSRLTLMSYLVHPVLMLAFFGSYQETIPNNYFFVLGMVVWFIFVSYGCAIAAHLLFEAPFLKLEKIMRKRFEIMEASEETNKPPVSIIENSKCLSINISKCSKALSSQDHL